jgi:hypothetical protein
MRLDALCAWAGARFVRARGTGLRPDRRELETDAADPADRLIAYDCTAAMGQPDRDNHSLTHSRSPLPPRRGSH